MPEPAHSARNARRGAVAVAALTAFLTVWTTIVRDDGSGAGSFMLLLAVPVGWFAAGFRAEGMARTMLGVAGMQVLLGLLVATAPITATTSDGVFKALLFATVFTALWLASGALFRLAARRERAA
jgi:hypothetical protein